VHVRRLRPLLRLVQRMAPAAADQDADRPGP
jgi:hypothetical protein